MNTTTSAATAQRSAPSGANATPAGAPSAGAPSGGRGVHLQRMLRGTDFETGASMLRPRSGPVQMKKDESREGDEPASAPTAPDAPAGDAPGPAQLDQALEELEQVSPELGKDAIAAAASSEDTGGGAEETPSASPEGGVSETTPAAGDEIPGASEEDLANLESELSTSAKAAIDKDAGAQVGAEGGATPADSAATPVVQAKLDPDSPTVADLLRRAREAKLIRVSLMNATWTYIAKYRAVGKPEQLEQRRYRRWITDYTSVLGRAKNAAERLFVRHTAAKVLAKLARFNIQTKQRAINKATAGALSATGLGHSKMAVLIGAKKNQVMAQINKMKKGNIEMLSHLSAEVHQFIPKLEQARFHPESYLAVLKTFLFRLELRERIASRTITETELEQIQSQVDDNALMEALDRGAAIPARMRARAAEFRAWKKKSYLEFQHYGTILKNQGYSFKTSWKNPVITTVGLGESNPEIDKVSFTAVVSAMRRLVANKRLAELDPRKYAKKVAAAFPSQCTPEGVKALEKYGAGMSRDNDRYVTMGPKFPSDLVNDKTFNPMQHTSHFSDDVASWHHGAIESSDTRAGMKQFANNVGGLIKDIIAGLKKLKWYEHQYNTELTPVLQWMSRQMKDQKTFMSCLN